MAPLSFLIKPVSGSCNLRCSYCFYADERAKGGTSSFGSMTRETMHAIVDCGLREAEGSLHLSFQGGEPTLRGLAFYQDLTAYVKQALVEKQTFEDRPTSRAKQHSGRKRSPVTVQYSLQTNGLLLDDDWCSWLHENNVLVGLSIDGPKELHDRYRRSAEGAGSYAAVLRAAERLRRHGVAFNTLTVVTEDAARKGQRIANFFEKQGFRYQQYIECLDPLDEPAGQHTYSLTPARYGEFLKASFDAWYQAFQAGRYVYNRYFENLLMILAGQVPESCALRGSCVPQWVIEADGSVYPCDFYVLDEWKLGMIQTDSLAEMERRRTALGFLEASCKVPEQCQACSVYALCRNGCRRNRLLENGGVNRFCAAYQSFLPYALPRLQQVLMALKRQANVR